MKNSVNGKDVTAHLFEYTTSFTLDPELHFKYPDQGIMPAQILFCLKEKNQKKINSHRWFFNAFGPLLQVCGLAYMINITKTINEICSLIFASCLMSGPALVQRVYIIFGRLSIEILMSAVLAVKLQSTKVRAGLGYLILWVSNVFFLLIKCTFT